MYTYIVTASNDEDVLLKTFAQKLHLLELLVLSEGWFDWRKWNLDSLRSNPDQIKTGVDMLRSIDVDADLTASQLSSFINRDRTLAYEILSAGLTFSESIHNWTIVAINTIDHLE